MANRPIFFPDYEGRYLVQEKTFYFSWSSGFAEVQKKKNIEALHQAAFDKGIEKVLEISTKSSSKIGQRLSAFSLKITLNHGTYPLESVYQGAKKFEINGTYPEIFKLTPREAKRFIRDKLDDRLVGFELEGKTYPLSPKNAFYDWLYIRSLADHADWITENVKCNAFTDIEFNPAKQVNCQARAFAEFLSLAKRSKLTEAVSNFSEFSKMLKPI